MATKDEAVTSASFDDFNTQLQGLALKATRNSVLLPADISYHRSMDPGFSKEIDSFSTRVLSLTNKLLTLAGTAHPSGKGKGRLEDEDDVVDNFHSLVVDSMDQMLERTDICLDDFLGRNKAPAIAVNPKAPAPKKKTITPKGQLDPAIQHASHLPKPQTAFKKKVDNSDAPWRPHLSHKYNAQVPLGYQYHDSEEDRPLDDVMKLHPYRYEVTHTAYPSHMFEESAPIPPQPFDSTTYKWVNTHAELTSMADELRKAKEIAVDLEHHSYRTYAGFLCLMQISTREQDWIIDLLALREEMEVLNEVFTNPKIVKIFHGAESDIVWLQQDLNLYIVNLFDTFHASKVLGFPRHGLANLLEMYCDFTPDKRYQLADWRIRPLPEEMLDYARSDTHFLLYIYDNLRNALLDRARSLAMSEEPSMMASTSKTDPLHALIREVLSRSEETALRVYEKEIYDAENGTGSSGWDTLARKWNKANLYNSAGATDREGRRRKYQIRSTQPIHIPAGRTTPAEMAALLRVFHSVPPVIRRRAKELLDTIRRAVKDQLEGEAQPTASHQGSRQETVVSTDIKEDVVMSDSTKEDVLWNHRSSPSNKLSSTNSSLFRPLAKAAPSRTSLATKSSSLFGKHVSIISTETTNRFSEIISRIHSTLVIAPTVTKVPVASVPTTNEDLEAEEGVLSATVQPEVPFVPTSQRVKNEPVEDDNIVVVGQARQKKRKRVKAAEPSGEPSNESDTRKRKKAKSPAADGVPQQPFDFDSVPNVLDEPSPVEDPAPKKRGKTKAKDKSFMGNFPAPPKAHRELRSANKSHTFK
ncbi:exosome nuclease subunit [Marasmius tenuissimus]|nr:exosome nuclease subunit [Marasmius tenuissimus]